MGSVPYPGYHPRMHGVVDPDQLGRDDDCGHGWGPCSWAWSAGSRKADEGRGTQREHGSDSEGSDERHVPASAPSDRPATTPDSCKVSDCTDKIVARWADRTARCVRSAGQRTAESERVHEHVRHGGESEAGAAIPVSATAASVMDGNAAR